jgi:hypothetical protein
MWGSMSRRLRRATALLLGALALTSCAPSPSDPTGPQPQRPKVERSAIAPVPADTAITAGRWTFRVGPVEWEQRDRVLAENISPATPPDGYGWAIIRLNVTNVSNEVAAPGGFKVVLHAGGWDVAHTEVLEYLYRMPDEFESQDIEPRKSLSGNLGFWIPDYAQADPGCRVELVTRARFDAPQASTWFSCER